MTVPHERDRGQYYCTVVVAFTHGAKALFDASLDDSMLVALPVESPIYVRANPSQTLQAFLSTKRTDRRMDGMGASSRSLSSTSTENTDTTLSVANLEEDDYPTHVKKLEQCTRKLQVAQEEAIAVIPECKALPS